MTQKCPADEIGNNYFSRRSHILMSLLLGYTGHLLVRKASRLPVFAQDWSDIFLFWFN